MLLALYGGFRCPPAAKNLKYDRMEWWQILLYVLAVLILLYLVGFFFGLSSLLSFRKKLQKRLVALSVLFAEKKDILLSLYALFDEAHIRLDSAEKDGAAKVRWLKTQVLKEEDVAEVAETLNFLQKRLTLLAESESYIKAGDDYRFFSSILQDLDTNYRRIVAVYNTEVNGYEYWRRAPIYFPLFWLCGFRKRQRLA